MITGMIKKSVGPPTHIIIVTHNSDEVLDTCLRHLEQQDFPVTSCVIVDNGSTDRSYLQNLETSFPVRLIETDNKGFGVGNNMGYRSLNLDLESIVVFLNPDTFLTPGALRAVTNSFLEDQQLGAVSGKLLGYDRVSNLPNGKIDSTGIYRTWFGRWYDRGQGELDFGQYQAKVAVPAICGALLCCRASCLQSLDRPVFDEDFFMYKEDIELCLRIKKKGWRLLYDPAIVAYHCRGWQNVRKAMDYRFRLMSAENEVKLYLRHGSPYMLWAFAKYIVARFFRI